MNSNYTAGWLIFAAALGSMCALLAVDVAKLSNWSDATAPSFVANILAHFGVVIGSFVGGKLIPTKEDK